MTTLAQTFEGSVVARWASAASIAVVLAAGLVSAGLKPGDSSPPPPVPSTSIVAPRQASAIGPQTTPVSAPVTTIPAPAPTTTKPPRVTPPFQVVPDDPSATVPPPVRGIDPISGD